MKSGAAIALAPLLALSACTSSPATSHDELALRLSTDHFDFYATERDRPVTRVLADELERNVDRVTGDLKATSSQRIRVLIYPDLATFHRAIGRPQAPDWLVGVGGDHELSIVSPRNPGPAHSPEDLTHTAVHELVHVIARTMTRQPDRVPRWLSEGLAYYEARQLEPGHRARIAQRIAEGAIPTLAMLESVDAVGFGEAGYGFSTTIVEYIVERWGMDAVVRFLEAPDDYVGAFGVSKVQFEQGWREEYLASRYPR